MKTRTNFAQKCIRFAVLSAALVTSLAPRTFAQLPIQESCSAMIQHHVDWIGKGLLGTNGTQLLYAGVIGTTSSHVLPNNITAAAPDLVQFSAARVFSTDRLGNLVFVAPLQQSPVFSVNPAFTAQITVTPAGVVTVKKLLNGKPFTLGVSDSFTATCVGNVLTGYANGTQYTVGLQDTVAAQGGPF